MLPPPKCQAARITRLPSTQAGIKKPTIFHCPIFVQFSPNEISRYPGQVYALTSFLRDHGAEAVAVADLDYVFSRDNPLYEKLEAGL